MLCFTSPDLRTAFSIRFNYKCVGENHFSLSFGAKTMGASMAQSRLKTIEKLETSGIEAPKVLWPFYFISKSLPIAVSSLLKRD
jgi:hypothetical protein